jgi:UDP-N-acetylmuramyl pentapeptide phosphotransferase/UDP-N-acetylglucosamine-1-phosphate transferase
MLLPALIVLACAFFLTFLVAPVVIEVASRNRLYDRPDQRKIHPRRVSSLGGVSILVGFLISCLFFIPFSSNPEIRLYLATGLVVFLLGLKDDLSDLSAKDKLIGQLFIAAVIIHGGGLRLEGMYGFLGMNEVPELFSYIITYLTIIVVMNAFNLIDGVDGLASGLAIVSLSVFGTYFLYASQPAYALMAFSMVGSILAFLAFNFPPARIFMGDSGSLLIGTLNAILVIQFIHTASSPAAILPVSGAVAVGYAILFVPLFDTFRVFSMRIMMGLSPFQPDRKHLHHLLLNRGYSHFQTTFICITTNIIFLLLAWRFKFFGSTLVLMAEMVFGFALLGVLYYGWAPAKRAAEKVQVPVIQMEREAIIKAE